MWEAGWQRRRQWVQGTGRKKTVDIDGALGKRLGEVCASSEEACAVRWTTFHTANTGLVQSRGQIWQEVQKKKHLPQDDSQTQDAQKAILFCSKYILVFVCWKCKLYLFFWPLDLLFLWAVVFSLKFLTAEPIVRPVKGPEYMFICTHLVKEWWVCNGMAEECGVELHLRFWFLRTERDLRGSSWVMGWRWCAADSLLLSLQSQSLP